MRRIWSVAPVNSALVALLFEKFFSLLWLGVLVWRCAWFEGGSRVSARQPTPFLLRRQKKWGKEKASLAGGLSGETHFAPASLRSDSRRKFEFLYGGTPVLRLACGVAQALRLELPLPLAGEGGGEGAYISFPHWGKAGMGASLLLVEAVCLLSGRESGLGPTADPISFASPKEMGERKGEPCRRLVRRNSLRSCVAPFRQPPEI